MKCLWTLNLVAMSPVPEETPKSHFVILFLTSGPPWLRVFWVLSNLWRQPARTKRNSKICQLANLWLRSFQLPAGKNSQRLTSCQHYMYVLVSLGQSFRWKTGFLIGTSCHDTGIFCLEFQIICQVYANSSWQNRISKCNSETNYKLPNASAMQIWFRVGPFLFCFVRFIPSTVVWNKRTDS